MNWLFAWRYFRSKKSANAINIIAWISVLAIAVGTAALIIVLSVFNGFEDLVKGLYSDFYSDIRISPATGKFIDFTPDVLQKIETIPGVAHYSAYIEEKAVLVNGDYQTIAVMKGVDEQYITVNGLIKHIERGEYNLGTSEAPAIIAGTGISNAVGADPENTLANLIIYLPNRKAANFSSMDAMHSYNIQTAGVFAVQQEFDDKYAFTNLAFMQYMLDLAPQQFSGVEIALTPNAKESAVKQALAGILGSKYSVQTRYEQNKSLFSIMQVEKWVIYGILSLILIVASFNMIGALTMLVLEKQKDIAVLKAMGVTAGGIQRIFLSEGLVLAGVGGGAGLLLAFIICMVQIQFHIIQLTGNTFIIDYYPVKMYGADFLLVAVTVITVALLAAYIPSRKAATQIFSLKS
ncbi:FtsX-like permease family protein [Limnovirga soli]|uniref:FtsX-like permease family protein n=1 Tax=Limnovirga soli TaxID=2656915 RepID=A0A8J8FDD1_9BACT|nr:FtsX-like permease family protein [Limnovirga soli]NNV55933.1 FtsX-like permease family protein [Limnovirga soli]